ncbi:MAG TPA: MBL fold metallo-hydrolase [Methanomassiliicoccales archaeon]|nr:MBL fold metallo-hydrolase [Methanomassiliicoccales archaeon]
MKAKVDVLCEGMIRRDGKVVLEARSSSTLVRTGSHIIVVDTSSSSNRQKLISALDSLKVRPEDVDILVITHDHHDHRENNDLFANAKVIMFSSEPQKEDEESQIDPTARLVRTPGHTPGSVSLFVEAERKYAIVGDALPIRDNYLKWVPPGVNYDPEKALRSMKRIADWADVVVPGHDAPFEVRR